ncbi:uncharacterized protein LOC120265668 [Dioscorea cayenensis subsp. rotundata]|uniref:Uncharacterized protein LOC120265668 n=1 Tax=Dioscorea cayennensis subsp. rotundata TaxID=55577 RepID=A0AB40BRH3_DIOCR|nr:uncharacterized protein LOC120265668 [Dioscorea cayenensis subsp. rotundata]
MMTIRKTVHTLLGFPDPEAFPINPHRQRTIPSDAAGLRALAGEIPKPRHVVASSAVGPIPKPTVLIDPGPSGAGGGLGLCTECLGFESLDVGSGGGEIGVEKVERSAGERPRRRVVAAAAEQVFPPPLASLAGKDGRRSSFLKAVRMDGRILLTEVTIERPEIMRASRRDGRLRLHLVGSYDHEEDEAGVSWEWGRVTRSEGVTCQKAVSGNHNHIPQWWNHRFVATA